MKRISLFSAIAVLPFVLYAQNFNYNASLQWSENPKPHTLSAEFKTASAVGILDDRAVEYKVEGKELWMYFRYHRIVKINDDKGIEMYNKIYLPMSQGSLITDVKARTILPDGKVINVPSDKVKEIEEDGRMYKLFAMEGIEKGAEVEYAYTTKRQPTYFGMEVYQTGSSPYEKLSFSLTVPEHLKFDAKGFNGFVISKDSIISGQRVLVGFAEKVAEIEEEKYAFRDPYLQRVEFKLSYNLATSENVRVNTWKDFAKRAYEVFTTFSPKDEKPLNNYMAQMKKPAADSEEGLIMAIEDHIKTTINIDEDLVGEDIGSLERIIKSRSADNSGIIRLFAAAFEKAAINYQLVFTGPRNQFPLDEELENWNRMDEIVFYFPAFKKYLSPSSIDLRYPYIPHRWAGTKGLFLKGTTIGSFKTAIGSFGEIQMEPYEQHAINMEAVVSFNPSMDTLLLHSRQIMKGYGATQLRPIYTFVPKEKHEEINREIIKNAAKGAEIENIKVENALLTDLSGNKPLIISADLKTTEMVDQAGEKLLVKIGEVIGPQVEMYQEKPRKLPVELEYPHVLDRKITFVVPAGYAVKNLDDLNINVQFKDGNDVVLGFISSYTQEANKVHVHIEEIYRNIRYPLSRFPEYLKVVNAAADFNKVVLVLEKK